MLTLDTFVGQSREKLWNTFKEHQEIFLNVSNTMKANSDKFYLLPSLDIGEETSTIM